jgi:hypothetical protein
VARLGLPPSKFLVSIMNFLSCSLIHFNPDALTTLCSFTMLCECWLGIPPDSSLFWYYFDMHSPAPWENRLLYPPVLKDQRKEPPMIARLSALVNRTAELHWAGHDAYHCVEEFHLRWIRPLRHREKLAYECPRLADPSRHPAEGEISTIPFNYCTNPNSNLACFLVQCSFLSGAN